MGGTNTIWPHAYCIRRMQRSCSERLGRDLPSSTARPLNGSAEFSEEFSALAPTGRASFINGLRKCIEAGIDRGRQRHPEGERHGSSFSVLPILLRFERRCFRNHDPRQRGLGAVRFMQSEVLLPVGVLRGMCGGSRIQLAGAAGFRAGNASVQRVRTCVAVIDRCAGIGWVRAHVTPGRRSGAMIASCSSLSGRSPQASTWNGSRRWKA